MTSVAELTEWFDLGVEQGATHMIVVCDTFDYEDYPVWVMPGKNVREVEQEYSSAPMQRIMEVYILDPKRRAEQLVGGTRVYNLS